MGQVRRDHLPSLQSFLTEERHANLLRLIPAVVITRNRTLLSPKTRTLVRSESPRRRASRGRTPQPYSHIRHCGVESQVVAIWAFAVVVGIEQVFIQFPRGSFERSQVPANANNSPH